jgi:hypothetical protein
MGKHIQEIDHRSTSQEESVEGIVQLHAAMMRLRVHIFLSGLDSEFDQIRGEILRKEPKMDLEAAYACVRRESQQRQIMGVPRLISENTAMIANRNQRGTSYNSSKGKNSQGSGKQNNYICTHCGESGHSKLRCYELIGYPEWWDFSKKPRKNITGKAALAISGESLPVQEETLMPTANVTQPGSIGKANVLSAITMDNTWIIDTGASDHMIRDCNKLQNLHPSSQQVISTTNGGISPITGKGSIALTPTITLDTILVVPSLECNLLSVSQITSALNCTVTFWPFFCVFQDILTRKTLGCGVKRGNLYYLELTKNCKWQNNKACSVTKRDRRLFEV